MNLVCSDLSMTFPAHKGLLHVLQGFSFEAKQGQVSGLIGPNGAGKTTFFHIVMGFLQQDAGVIQYGDKTFDPLNPKTFSPSDVVTLLPEHPHIPKYESGWDVLKEYGLYCGLSPEETLVRLQEINTRLPLSSFWERPSLRYSRGQAGMISLARAFMKPKPIIILDEPTIGLDFEVATSVRHWIRELAQEGHTVIVSSHVLSDIKNLADSVTGLREGSHVSFSEVQAWMKKWEGSIHEQE